MTFRVRFARLSAVFAVLLILSGCSQISDLIKTGRRPAAYVHRVQWAGESLSIIARWHTGSIENWKAIARANPNLDPDLLRIGDEVRIPEDLLQNRDPMPGSFVASFAPKGEGGLPPAQKKVLSPKPAYHVHTVKWPGESLSIISKWYTGDMENWRALARANPGLDPNRIHVGERVQIPLSILKTGEPMPRDFVASFESTRDEQAPPAEPSPPPPTEREPELFGPKGFPKK